jgi:hypothetical protein
MFDDDSPFLIFIDWAEVVKNGKGTNNMSAVDDNFVARVAEYFE